MIQKLKKSSGKTVGFKLTGRLTDTEYKAFIAGLETIITEQGKIRLLMIVDYPQHFEFKAAWDDFIFWIKHIKDIERLAIVGQKEWEKWLEFPESLFLKTRYYSLDRLDKAWKWINSQSVEKVI
jgi:hypothetical protein